MIASIDANIEYTIVVDNMIFNFEKDHIISK